MNNADQSGMRNEIKALIDDIAFQSESLADLGRMPVIQLKVLLGKLNKLTEKTIILLHYLENSQSGPERANVLSEEGRQKASASVPASMPDAEVKAGKSADTVDKSGKGLAGDLMSVIGINEKYLFAGALFEGRNAEFAKAVSDINAIGDASSLDGYLKDLGHRYGWDTENEIVKRFVELSGRKFD